MRGTFLSSYPFPRLMLSSVPFGPLQAAAVTGGARLRGVLSLYSFGIKESPIGPSLAMYPLVGLAFQAQGHVSKGRHFFSDAPFRRFP